MRSNSIAVVGNIYPPKRDIAQLELIFSASGTPYLNYNLSAWSHKDKDDVTQYISYRCVVFGDMAEYVADSLTPGDTVIVLGRLQSNNWESDDGEKHYDQQLLTEEIGASLRWNPVNPVRAERTDKPRASSSGAPKGRDDYGSDESPF